MTVQHPKLVIAIILIVLLAVFTLQNAAIVTIRFLFWEFTTSRAVMIFLLLAAGIAIGLILAGYQRAHKRRRD